MGAGPRPAEERADVRAGGSPNGPIPSRSINAFMEAANACLSGEPEIDVKKLSLATAFFRFSAFLLRRRASARS